jgi:DNA-binding response OmpR family regulator
MRSSEIQARTKGDRGKRKPLPQKYVRMRPAGTDRQAKRILVVDDEPQIVEIVERYLSDEGFRVSHAYDGAEAIKIVDEEPPDLIVLDLKMPVVNGSEALREIRSRSGVPIIMLTSRTDEVDRIVGLELGADDYINKPFSPREVVARVKAVLRRSHPDEMRASASGNAAATQRSRSRSGSASSKSTRASMRFDFGANPCSSHRPSSGFSKFWREVRGKLTHVRNCWI